MDQREVRAASRPILSGWVTQGPEVAAFEREFAEYVGAGSACAVSSCTAALHLALLAAGVSRGDEVITVSHSFIATANAIRYCGATPVFADIERSTYNVDVARIPALLSKRTRAILAVHQLGMPCELERLVSFAREHGLVLIEDAACAVGSEIVWSGSRERIGKPHGDVACFSFHPRKLVSTGDGGMVTTNQGELHEKLRLLRQHGMSIPDTERHLSDKVVFESYLDLGYNYRMTDIQAAVGREQLKRLPEAVATRRKAVERYRALLSRLPEVGLPVEPDWARSNWQSFCVRLPERVDQKNVMQHMLEAGIATRRAVMCAHREPAYREAPWACAGGRPSCKCAPSSCEALVASESVQDRGIMLPLFSDISTEQQERVVDSLAAAIAS